MTIQELSEHLAGLWYVASEEGRNVFQTASEVLNETRGVQRDHLSEGIEFRQVLSDNLLSSFLFVKRVDHRFRRFTIGDGFHKMVQPSFHEGEFPL